MKKVIGLMLGLVAGTASFAKTTLVRPCNGETYLRIRKAKTRNNA